MASTGNGGTLPPNFLLTPQQQGLLFAALNSNKSHASPTENSMSMSPEMSDDSPIQKAQNHRAGMQESPYLDQYDYEFGDSSFDFSFADDHSKMIGDFPGTEKSDSTENEHNEKRSHPDDEDDETTLGNDPKRRESTDKVPKKPGRKPLTSEPSSKRKAQNRAAQRAFRERKEKHLKDLETKVEELEKESQAANHENGRLRAQVERMTAELQQYKSKVSLMNNSTKPLPREKLSSFGHAAVSSLGEVNFQFEFPKFGMLPGPRTSKSQSPPTQSSTSHTANATRSRSNDQGSSQSAQQFKEDLARFSGVFSPSMSSSTTNPSRTSVDSGTNSVAGATSSPSASSQSNGGPNSSCGTSPEPFTQSPMGFKPVETLTTIGEEQSSTSNNANQPFAQFAEIDFSNTNFDWLAQQNGGNFDPQLFGNYREPQDNILSNPTFDEFFNDALDADFFTPYNTATSNLAKNEAPKKSIVEEIDARQDAVDEEPLKQPMSCNQLWEKLQAYPNAQTGDFDLDGLCSELTKKAKCSGSGPVVQEQDFNTILRKYMGKDVSSDCIAEKMGVEINRDTKAAATL